MHQSLRFIACRLNTAHHSFIDTNLIHNVLYKLHKVKFLYMFRATSSHPQEVNDVNCTCTQPLVFSFSADGHLQRMRIPEAAYMYN